jgi:hypothetical protein
LRLEDFSTLLLPEEGRGRGRKGSRKDKREERKKGNIVCKSQTWFVLLPFDYRVNLMSSILRSMETVSVARVRALVLTRSGWITLPFFMSEMIPCSQKNIKKAQT